MCSGLNHNLVLVSVSQAHNCARRYRATWSAYTVSSEALGVSARVSDMVGANWPRAALCTSAPLHFVLGETIPCVLDDCFFSCRVRPAHLYPSWDCQQCFSLR